MLSLVNKIDGKAKQNIYNFLLISFEEILLKVKAIVGALFLPLISFFPINFISSRELIYSSIGFAISSS